MSTFPKKEYPVKWIRVSDLSVVWAQAQRGLDDGKVKKIISDFDPDAVGVIQTTLPNGRGIHHVIDGQHRVEAVRRLWGDGEMVPCMVLNAKTAEDAARIWRLMNGARTRPQAVDDFRVAVTAQEAEAVEINELIDQMGYKIAFNGDDGVISCVAALRAIYRRRGLAVLRDTLLLIQACYGMQRDAVHSNIVQGFAEVVARLGEKIDRRRLVDRLSKKYTPARLIASARQARDFNGRTLTENVGIVIVGAYNNNLRPDARLDFDN